MTQRPFLILVTVLCLGSSLRGQAIDPKMKVETIYQNYCASCHGKSFEGGSGGSLVDGVWKHGASDAEITRSIAKGQLALGMVPWEGVLSADQIRAMVVYLREREKAEAGKTTAFPVPAPNEITRTQHHAYKLEVLARDGLKNPWAIAFLPDGRRLITEKSGRLRLMAADGTLDPEPVRGTPAVMEHGQGGLMDVAVHPDYAKNGWIYLVYADGWRDGDKPRALTVLARGRLKDREWVDHEVLWQGDKKFYTGQGVHFGSRIVFDKGCVYFVVGERGGWQEAQDKTRPNGKIFRLKDDGSVPFDNPFTGESGALPGIWSYGHRNPQGLALDPRNGDLYSTEHGPRGGDEFNLIRKGANYGWPVITYGMNYNGTPITGKTAEPGMEQPVIHWTPSIAACGLAAYQGGKFPRWQSDFFAGALAQKEVRRLRVVNREVTEQEVVVKDIGRIRDVKCGPDGLLYLVVNGPDWIVRLVPAD